MFAEAQPLSGTPEESPVMMPSLPNWGTNTGGKAAMLPLYLLDDECQTCWQDRIVLEFYENCHNKVPGIVCA